MVLLGSTGSIGRNALEVAKYYNISVEVLVAGRNHALLTEQIKQFKPKAVVVADEKVALNLQGVCADACLYHGQDAILQVIRESKSDLVLNALVGFLGLKPTVESLKMGKKVALANKESLVAAGAFIDTTRLIPVDSEHFSLWHVIDWDKCRQKLWITASGGALRDMPLEQIAQANIQDVLAHPNWSMGAKITVDSATMCNKLFELIEGKWLFGIDDIDACIESSSSVHAAVQYVDGSMGMHLAFPDMQLPIAYALQGGCIKDEWVKPLDMMQMNLHFKAIDPRRYALWSIKDDLLSNPHWGVVLNASNEVLVEAFLDKRLAFGDIALGSLKALKHFDGVKAQSLDEVFEIDEQVRTFVRQDVLA